MIYSLNTKIDGRKNGRETQEFSQHTAKKIINEILTILNDANPSFYYLSTVEVAAEVKKYIQEPSNLSYEKLELVKKLEREDIHVLLSFH